MQRAAVSIPANLVEGCGRHAQGELSHFVQIAIASANELAYFLILTQDLNYLETSEAQEKTDAVKKSLIAFQKKVRERIPRLKTSHLPLPTSHSM